MTDKLLEYDDKKHPCQFIVSRDFVGSMDIERLLGYKFACDEWRTRKNELEEIKKKEELNKTHDDLNR